MGVLQLCISFSKQYLAIFIQSLESFITHIVLLLDTISTLEYQYHDILSKKTKFALSDSSISKQIPATLFQIFMEYWYIYDTCWQAFSSILGNDYKFTMSADTASAACLRQPLCSAAVTGHASARGTILHHLPGAGSGVIPVFQPWGSRIWFTLSPVLTASNNKTLYLPPAWCKQYSNQGCSCNPKMRKCDGHWDILKEEIFKGTFSCPSSSLKSTSVLLH